MASPSLGPDYRKVWTATAASNLADGIFWIALPLIAVTLTTEPALVAGVAIAARLPWLFFVLFAGVIADRVDRRTTMRDVQLLGRSQAARSAALERRPQRYRAERCRPGPSAVVWCGPATGSPYQWS